MRKIAVASAALVAGLGSLASPAVAGHGHGGGDDGGHGHHGGHSTGPDTIDLPNGWQPEGITTDGKSLYVGSLVDGAILKVNSKSGASTLLAEGAEGRVAVGVDYDKRRDLLWIAGGPTNEVRAQDADTGKVVATYAFPSETARFFNDIVVTREGVFVTDSSNQELAVIPLKHGGHDGLPSADKAFTLPLTGDLVYTEGFNLNGIVADHHSLLAVQSNTGLLFRIDPKSGDTEQVDLGGYLVTNGDGLELDGSRLFVVRNQDNLVAVVKLKHHGERGKVVKEVTDDDLDVPSTAAFARGSLWAVNARFNTTPEADTPYWIARLDVGHGHGGHGHGGHGHGGHGGHGS